MLELLLAGFSTPVHLRAIEPFDRTLGSLQRRVLLFGTEFGLPFLAMPLLSKTKQNTMINRGYSTAVKRLYPRPLLSRSPQRVLRRGASNFFRFLNI